MVSAPFVISVLARVLVHDIDHALPIYQALSGEDQVRRFTSGEVELAWIGSFLLISGPPAALASYVRVATLLVTDIQGVRREIEFTQGSIIEGPVDAPDGLHMTARHADGAIFEYIEPRGGMVR